MSTISSSIYFICLVVSFEFEVRATKVKAANKIIEEEFIEQVENNFKCKNTKLSYFNWLMNRGQLKNAKFCLASYLKRKPKSSKAWSLLGEIYDVGKQTKKANLCFKEAIKLEGKFSPYLEYWDFLGPFPIGKAELDGDPIENESYQNDNDIIQKRWNESFSLNSEIVRNSAVSWQTIHQVKNEKMQIYPEINWNELVNSLQSTGITEWQGLVVSDFAVNEDKMELLFQCQGFHTFQVDDITLTGDVYHRNQYWFPVPFKRGIHQLKMHLRAKPAAMFDCQLKAGAKHATLKLHQPQFVPDFIGNVILSRYLSIPVSNLNSQKWIKISKVSVGSSDFPDGVDIDIKPAHDNLNIAPGQLSTIKNELLPKFEEDFNHILTCNQKTYSMTLKVAFSDGNSEQVQVTFQCRNWQERFSFTFEDHDGSIQYAAAIPPLEDCKLLRACPVLLTLHGTGVKAENQADSYKRMVNGNFKFGVEKLWVLAPTRHGAHNWEGPGELTSMTALYELEKLTKEHTWIKSKASPKYVVFAGHSMGGHGSWQLSLHHPDLAIGVISAAGWLKKEDYGDSNLFYRHDIAVSHTDPAIKAIQEACIAENDADKHASVLKGIPIMIRIGADDRTVHPFFSRRMFRILKENAVNVTYHEYHGKDHWWWDTFTTNDGGVTNDPVIRGFAIQRAEELEKTLRNTCTKGSKSSSQCTENLKSGKQRYKNQENNSRNINSPFTIIVYNPASFKGLRGVRVLQQIVPFRQSKVKIVFSKNIVKLKTSNVDRLLLYEPAISPIMWKKKTITIDDTELEKPQLKDVESNIQVCKVEHIHWELCQDQNEHFETEMVRGPSNLGPARRIAERPFLIVTGTQGSASVNNILLQLAVYLANLFFLTSDTHVSIVKDKNLDENIAVKYNLIIIGSKTENLWTDRFMDRVPLKHSDNIISLGQCKYSEKNMGILLLVPHATRHLALIMLGTTTEGLRNIFTTAMPTIPPMTRSPFSNMIPDYVITGADFKSKGPGGFLCTGFWGNTWDYRRELSSCAC